MRKKKIPQSKEFMTATKNYIKFIIEKCIENGISLSLFIYSKHIFANQEDFKKYSHHFEEVSVLEFEQENLKYIKTDDSYIYVDIYFANFDEVFKLKINYMDIMKIYEGGEIVFINAVMFNKIEKLSKNEPLEDDEEENEDVNNSMDILLSIDGNSNFFKK